MSVTSWTTAADVRAEVNRRWQRGTLLRCVVDGDGGGGDTFPLRIALRRPTHAEIGTRFAEARAWATDLARLDFVRVEYRAISHRQVGANELPFAVWIESIDDAARLVPGGRDALGRLRSLVDLTASRLPGARAVLGQVPFECLAAEADWPGLLDVATWLRANPRPMIHVRQISLPGVDTKLLERNRKLVARLFDSMLPDEVVDRATSDLAARYGFATKPRLVRFRALDPSRRFGCVPVRDVTLPAADLAYVDPPQRVFITENEINFLAFPDTSVLPSLGDSFVVFGAGSGLDHLAAVPWLASCGVYYWGDIDTHGLAILDQLRRVVPHARSMLMDRDTLLAHRAAWVAEPSPANRALPLLTADEQALYEELRSGAFGANVRLEQELIRFDCVLDGLRRLA